MQQAGVVDQLRANWKVCHDRGCRYCIPLQQDGK